jgi:signal transduction histidine kinase
MTRLEDVQAPAGEPAPVARARRATERNRQAIAATGRELRRPLSVLTGLTEYYRHHDQLTAADFDRLLGRVAAETARIDAIIGDRLRPGQDESDPPASPGTGASPGPQA